MNLKTTLRVILSLFDGGTAAAGAAAGASGGAEGGASAQGETTNASSSPTRKGKRANTPTSYSASRRHLTIRGHLLASRRARARRCSSTTPGLRKKAGKT